MDESINKVTRLYPILQEENELFSFQYLHIISRLTPSQHSVVLDICSQGYYVK